MRLDKSNKYAFAGDTYAWTQEQQRWSACYLTFVWKEGEFQHFADRGLVSEQREPRRVRVRCEFDRRGFMLNSPFRDAFGDAVNDHVKNSIFEGELVEVLL